LQGRSYLHPCLNKLIIKVGHIIIKVDLDRIVPLSLFISSLLDKGERALLATTYVPTNRRLDR
jgi:hypothetical protein